MDIDLISHPLRLAEGSYRPESGEGCAMNVICYMTGDTEITDFPACSARPLAAFVNWCNDVLAGSDGYLSPQDSVLALELAWSTVGSASVPENVIHEWVAELLVNPLWGVIGYAENAAAGAIFDIAELHRKVASGETVPVTAWDAADRAARAAARATNEAQASALRAAYQSTAPMDTDHGRVLDAVTGHALRAHALATAEAATSYRAVELARRAISAWRFLAGLDYPGDGTLTSVENLERHMSAA